MRNKSWHSAGCYTIPWSLRGKVRKKTWDWRSEKGTGMEEELEKNIYGLKDRSQLPTSDRCWEMDAFAICCAAVEEKTNYDMSFEIYFLLSMHNSQGVWGSQNTHNALAVHFSLHLNLHSLNRGLCLGWNLKAAACEITIIAVNTFCREALERAADNR